jgi:hypothetical protein
MTVGAASPNHQLLRPDGSSESSKLHKGISTVLEWYYCIGSGENVSSCKNLPSLVNERRIATEFGVSTVTCKVLLKLDFKNAFNSVERNCILKEVQCHTPLLYPYLYQCYRNPSTLFFGNHLISSFVGAQQGDPCGSMIFSLAIQPTILSLDSQLNIWYLNDGTLADYPEVVLSDFKKVIYLSRKNGLE